MDITRILEVELDEANKLLKKSCYKYLGIKLDKNTNFIYSIAEMRSELDLNVSPLPK